LAWCGSPRSSSGGFNPGGRFLYGSPPPLAVQQRHANLVLRMRAELGLGSRSCPPPPPGYPRRKHRRGTAVGGDVLGLEPREQIPVGQFGGWPQPRPEDPTHGPGRLPPPHQITAEQESCVGHTEIEKRPGPQTRSIWAVLLGHVGADGCRPQGVGGRPLVSLDAFTHAAS